MSEHYNRCAVAVEEILNSENIPDTTRTFVGELAANLRKEKQNERRDEENESLSW
jgi:hypothetical protein